MKQAFIEVASFMHDCKYDYSVAYIHDDLDKKISIICPKHKFCFWITANEHLEGKGCPKCKEENNGNNNN